MTGIGTPSYAFYRFGSLKRQLFRLIEHGVQQLPDCVRLSVRCSEFPQFSFPSLGDEEDEQEYRNPDDNQPNGPDRRPDVIHKTQKTLVAPVIQIDLHDSHLRFLIQHPVGL